MLKLRLFEKVRLGDESAKSYRINNIMQFITIPVFLVFAFLNWGETVKVGGYCLFYKPYSGISFR